MGLQAGQYSMQCWRSTQNPNQMNKPRLLFQSLQLIKALQERFTDGEIAIPSRNTKTDGNNIEICIFYRAGASLFADIAVFLTETAESMGFDYRNFVKQDAGITKYYSQRELDNVSILDKPVPDHLDESLMTEYSEKSSKATPRRGNEDWRNNVKSENLAPPFMITRPTLERLHKMEGNELEAEIKSVLHAFQTSCPDDNSAFATILKISGGAIPIETEIDLGKVVIDAVFHFLLEAFFTEIVVASFNPGVLITALVGAVSYLTLKDSINVLLVVNETAKPILPLNEHIENGDQRVVPEMIPAAVPNADLVPCGLFIYSKNQVLSQPMGLYGSAFGISLNTGNGYCSVGMDCPNSILGGNNSIYVTRVWDAKLASEKAIASGTMHDWCSDPYVDGKIADHWGNVNWGRAVVIS